MQPARQQRGFTIIEAVIVIVIAGIVAGMVAVFITRPVEGYADLSRRAELVDQAEIALKRMQREIRRGLPNSVRIRNLGAGTGQVLEFFHVRSGGRYRTNPGGAGYSAAACRLRFNNTDDSFAVMGTVNAAPQNGDQIAISNWNTLGPDANAYAGDNITPSSTTITLNPADAVCSENYLSLDSAFAFPFESPQQRFYIVDTPVTYLCDTTAGTLRRYANYTTNIDHSTLDTAAELNLAGASSALVVDDVTACDFTYAPGTPSRSGLVTLTISVSQDNETIALQQQFHVSNVP
jgi:MSHA biogenesis protein MshO